MKTETHTLPQVCWCSQNICARAQDYKIDHIPDMQSNAGKYDRSQTRKNVAVCASAFNRCRVTIDRTVVLRSVSKVRSHATAY